MTILPIGRTAGVLIIMPHPKKTDTSKKTLKKDEFSEKYTIFAK